MLPPIVNADPGDDMEHLIAPTNIQRGFEMEPKLNLGTAVSASLRGMTKSPERIACDEVNGLVISTIHAHEGFYETAILDAVYPIPVERYGADREAALKGHAEWMKKAETIETVTKLGYGDLAQPEIVTLTRKEM